MLKLCKSKFAYFGENSSIRPGAFIVGCSQIEIGKNVVIRPGTMLHAETASLTTSIVIEDDVLIGLGVHIYVENHRFSDPSVPIFYQGHSQAEKVVLCQGCWLGANVIILPGVVVGENSVIAAGSVVTKSIPPRSVAAGVPAKVIRSIQQNNNLTN